MSAARTSDAPRNVILCGDVREKLRELPDESVNCVVTSPPYWGLRDYGTAAWEGGDLECAHKRVGSRDSRPRSGLEGGTATVNYAQEPQFRETCGYCGAVRIDSQLGLEATPEAYVESMVAVFREVRRVLRKDGTLWLNLGDSYASAWSAGNRRSIIGQTEPPPIESRGRISAGLKEKDLVGIPWRVAFALQADGWYLRSDIIWSKPNPMPESVTDRPTKAHEYLFLMSKSPTYYYDAAAIAEKAIHAGEFRITTAKSFAGQATGAGVRATGNAIEGSHVDIGATRNRRTVWEIATEHYAEAHFATFPTELVKPCIQAGTSEYGCCSACGAPWSRLVDRAVSLESGSGRSGRQPQGKWAGMAEEVSGEYDIRMGPVVSTRTTGWQPTCKHEAPVEPAIVLDPFMGSGTTALVALRAKRDYIGIELNPAYVLMAEARLAALKAQGRLL